MAKVLTDKEYKTLYIVQAWARPLLMYAMTLIFFILSIMMIILVWSKEVSLNDASGILMTIVGIIGPVVSFMVIGRSYEKGKGAAAEASTIDSPSSSSSDNTSYVPEDNVPIDSNPDDPFADLKKMDLSEYQSKVADDRPSL